MNKPKFMLVKWRLQQLPTAEGVAMLVEQGVLTVAEARFILLRELPKEYKEEGKNE